MKKINLLALVLVAAFSTFLISCGGEGHQDGSEMEGQNEAVVMTDSIHTYICPMNCENSASMAEGPCPVCGMDLKPNPNYSGETVEESVDESMEESMETEEGEVEAEESHDGHDHEGHDHG